MKRTSNYLLLFFGLTLLLSGRSQAEVVGFDDFNGGKTGWNWLCAGGRSAEESQWKGAVTIVDGKLITEGNSTAYILFNSTQEGVGSDEAPTGERLGAFRNTGTLVCSVEFTMNGDANSWSGLSYYDFGEERILYGMPDNSGSLGSPQIGANGAIEVGKTYNLVSANDFSTGTAAMWAFDQDVTPTYKDIRNPLVKGTAITNWLTRVRVGSGTPTSWDNLTVANSYGDIFDYSGLKSFSQMYPVLSESFSGYTAGSIGGQAYQGSIFYGYKPFGSWSGSGSVISDKTLTYDNYGGSGGMLMVEGGTNNSISLDFNALKQLGVVGSDGTVGGTDVSGSLYYSFLMQKVAGTPAGTEGWFGGAQLFDGGTEVLGIGKHNGAWAYSVFGQVGTRDLNSANHEDGATYEFVGDTDTHLVVVKLDYKTDADDQISIWFDPDMSLSEADQLSSLLTTWTTSDVSFDSIQFRGGMGFYYDEFRMGGSWEVLRNSQVPEPSTWGMLLLGVCSLGLAARKYRK